MSQALLAMMGAGSPAAPTYVDDVFSAYTYTGNGSTQTITNGINLSTNGGMVWIKDRGTSGFTDNTVHDSARGATSYISTVDTNANNANSGYVSSFNSNGFSLGNYFRNENTHTYVSWTFRKAARFFDVVTYTGDGVNRTVSHSLGQVPGMIMVKRTNSTGSWMVYHRSLTSNVYNLVLNTTAAETSNATAWNSTTATSSVFSLGTHADVNTNGATYVAYLFAHDTGADGLVQCGSYTGNGSATGPTVTLGWEPQFLMIKNASGTGSWQMIDAMRGMPVGSADATLQANATTAEAAVEYLSPTATGFQITSTSTEVNTNTSTYIYVAIRRPNKPPTVGTQVYNAIARTGTGAAATVTGVGFAPDLVALHSRSGTTGGRWEDRLRGATIELVPETTAAETTVAQSITSFGMDGFSLGTDGDWNTNTATYINWLFKRAPGVFDVVCYTGDSVGTRLMPHNLGCQPELIISKNRGTAGNWQVTQFAQNVTTTSGTNYWLNAISTAAALYTGTINAVFGPGYSAPTSTSYPVGIVSGSANDVNTSANTYVAYLFATKSGISKVGTYTGNGTTNAIACGFTTGARFALIKRTDSTGDWYVWDTVRGIVAGNDPYLLINSTAAEATSTDYIDPSTAGFELSSTAPAAINANGGTFIFLAFS